MTDIEAIRLTVALNTIRTNKDGGGKITFEFGSDSIESIKKLISANGDGETVFIMGLVKLDNFEL